MPRIKIFNNNDIKAFENPPEFNGEERKRFFYFPKWAEKLILSFRTPTNQVGFILQFGYFKATGRFFVTRKFHQNDIEFIANRLEIQLDELDLGNYTTGSFLRHQEIILDNMGVRKFNRTLHKLLVREAGALASKRMKPRFMFLSLVDFLKNQKIEIPNYYAFEEIITDALRTFEKSLIKKVQKRLSTADKQLLDQLLEIGNEYTDGDKQESKIKRYKLTLLKKTNQSTQPSKIRENIKDLQCLDGLFKKINPVISTLDLSSELIQYYAQVVIKSQIFQTSRREDDRKYLLLMSFVAYQYYQLNDVLIEILMQSVQSTLNTTKREHKDFFLQAAKRKK